MALICLRSFAFLTKESAKKSTVFLIPKRRSFLSFSVKEGAETLTPGRFIPLCSFNLPPLIILQVTVSLVLDKTFSSMSPSSISILSPFFTSFDKFLYVVETISASPGTCFEVIRIVLFFFRRTGFQFFKVPVLILGP